MRILVALDAFKGSVDQVTGTSAVIDGLKSQTPRGWEFDACPLADGGEGTLYLPLSRGGRAHRLMVPDAYGRSRESMWVQEGSVAWIESAQGSPFVPLEEIPGNPWDTTSRGTGRLIAEALSHPAIKEVWVALGGTGSVDGGIGLLGELGVAFYDSGGQKLVAERSSWSKVARVSWPHLEKPLVALTDVQVPLLGPQGALQQFGPQKGLKPEDIPRVEPSLKHFADVLGGDHGLAGTGAAGGIGYALHALGARLEPGAPFVAKWANLDHRIEKCDVVITGEGRLDEQSLLGKVPSVVLASAVQHRRRVIVVAGQIPDDLAPFYAHGVWLALSIQRGPVTLSQARLRTQSDLYGAGQLIGRMLSQCQAALHPTQQIMR